jgi:hypothetical protein
METSGIFFKKDENGNLNISFDDLRDFNTALIKVSIPASGQLIEYNPINFNTCKFRSEKPIVRKQTCCSGVISSVTGFYCKKLDLFNIRPPDCFQCPSYEPK